MTSHRMKEVVLNSNARENSSTVARELAEAFSGRYEITEPVGHADGASYYLARDLTAPSAGDASGQVCLKVLSDAAAQDSERLNLFRLEAKAASSLSHENILKTECNEETGPYHSCAIERVDGAKTLRSLLNKKGWLDAQLASTIAIQVARALEEAHGNGVLHLKLSPEKILIGPDGVVKLADFGIEAAGELQWAHALRSGLCPARYASPEQSSGEPVDHRSDLYSLGVVLFESLTDRFPFNADGPERGGLKQRGRSPLPPHVYCESVPADLSSVVMRLLERDPADRFESASELQAALSEFVPAAFFAPRPAPEISPEIHEPADREPEGGEPEASDLLTPSVASERVVSMEGFNTFDLDFDIEPLGNLLPDMSLQKHEEQDARRFQEIEPAPDSDDLNEHQAGNEAVEADAYPVSVPLPESESVEWAKVEEVAEAEPVEEVAESSEAIPELHAGESREGRLAANSQRIAEKIRAATIIEPQTIEPPIIDAPAIEVASVEATPRLQPAITAQAISPAKDRYEPEASEALVVIQPLASQPLKRAEREIVSAPDVSGFGGRRSAWWLAFVAVIALSVGMIAFADRFTNLTSGGPPAAPAEQVREAGTFVPTPASAMPESMTNKSGGDTPAKPAERQSPAPPVNSGALSSTTPPAAARSGAAAKPAARKAQSRTRKSRVRRRTSRQPRVPVYNPRYN
ncbi:MAG TPA: serine/threonine-protein kinase [Blastocatellia bacterium]|nr:serine/threonine-protein kinase [Blastocatellia bacterium]